MFYLRVHNWIYKRIMKEPRVIIYLQVQIKLEQEPKNIIEAVDEITNIITEGIQTSAVNTNLGKFTFNVECTKIDD